MQELQALSAISFAAVEPPEAQQAEAEAQVIPVKCPRCESSNTKFCYYNNYNLSQPRHLCKNCRRYWTKGGALRNIPIGGGTRKRRPNPNPPSSRSTTKRTTSSAPSSDLHPPLPKPEPLPPLDVAAAAAALIMDHDKMSLDFFTGSFSSLLHHSNGSGHHHHHFDNNNNILGDHASSSSSSTSPPALPPPAAAGGGLGLGDLGDLNRSNDDNLLTWPANGWPDLAIYTPGSTFQ